MHACSKPLAAFARKGLDSVDLSDVAAKADVPLGTVYRYFPSSTHLMLALYRHQLEELEAAARRESDRFRGRALPGVVMEIFHMRVMQPAVEQCLSRGVYLPDRDTTALLRDIDALGAEGSGGRRRRCRGRQGPAAVRHWSGPVRPEPPAVPLRGRRGPQKGLLPALSGRGCPVHTPPDGVTGLDQFGIKYAFMAWRESQKALNKRFGSRFRCQDRRCGLRRLPTIDPAEQQGANIPEGSYGPATPGFPVAPFSLPEPARVRPHVPCVHGEHQETTTCPLTQLQPLTIPQPPP